MPTFLVMALIRDKTFSLFVLKLFLYSRNNKVFVSIIVIIKCGKIDYDKRTNKLSKETI